MTMPIGLSIAPIVALIILRLCKRRLRHWSRRRRILGASLEDLVEFPSVEPNPAALRAIVNLDALSLTHHKGNLTDRTWHTGGAGHRWTS
jgi:hypothetical protein